MKLKFKFLSLVILCVAAALAFAFRHNLYNYMKGFRNKGKLLYFRGKWRVLPEKYFSIRDFNGFRPFLKPSLKLVNKGQNYSIHLLKLRREGGIAPFNVYIFAFDPQYYHFRIHFKPQREFIKNFHYNDMIFGINASFFDSAGKIIGLTVSNGSVINRSIGKKQSHFLVYKNKKNPEIRSATIQRQDLNNILEAVRGYPLIMSDGIVFNSILSGNPKNSAISRRTVAAKLLDGSIAFLVTDTLIAGLSLRELPAILGGIGVRDALNFDGGGSTQTIFRTQDFIHEISGTDKIPVIIGVHPRNEE